MRRSLLLHFLLGALLCSHTGWGQGARKFVGRVILVDGGKPLANAPVRLVDQGNGATNSDGIFAIAVSSNTPQVTLELVNSNWSVIYPIGGVAKILRDSNESTNFYVGQSAKDILTRAIAVSNNDIKNKLGQLGIQQNGIEETLAAFREEIQKMSNIKIEALQDQMDLASKREHFYPVLASAINNYTNEAKDLKDAFKFIARNAFDDPQALQLLTNSINSYNVAFEDVNRNHSGYEKMVGDLWNEARATEVRDFFSYALGELHSANIFTLNLKVKDINDYFRGNVKGSKKTAKELIMHDIESSTLQLERRLNELDNRAQVLLSKLAT